MVARHNLNTLLFLVALVASALVVSGQHYQGDVDYLDAREFDDYLNARELGLLDYLDAREFDDYLDARELGLLSRGFADLAGDDFVLTARDPPVVPKTSNEEIAQWKLKLAHASVEVKRRTLAVARLRRSIEKETNQKTKEDSMRRLTNQIQELRKAGEDKERFEKLLGQLPATEQEYVSVQV